jgi:hypothetical protein
VRPLLREGERHVMAYTSSYVFSRKARVTTLVVSIIYL